MKWLTAILLLSSFTLLAQSNQKCRWVTEFDRPQQLDSLSIVPGSFSLSEKAKVFYDINSNTFSLSTEIRADSINVCYSVFPVLLTKTYSNRSRNSGAQVVKEIAPKAKGKMLKENHLIKSGIISRGASIGNTQDMAINSRMDLHINGKVTDNLNLEATIFDQNVPYQPEGNTNSLKNFDRLHINIYNDNVSLEAGDVYLKGSISPFLKYSRGIMGIGLSVKDSSQSIKVKTGINKGRYHSDSFMGSDGISGPYRISGPVSDPFVLILAGSERVYLDGTLLVRGVDEDYVIDYNLGEITFTNKRIISRYSRIRVDFEFMNRSYQRSAKSIEYSISKSKLKFYTSYFTEKDNPMVSSGISEEEKLAMSSPNDGLFFNATPVEYVKGRASYVMTDSVGQSVLVYSEDSTMQHYQVKFHAVGPGKGNYVRDYQFINEVVFKWIPPSGDQPLGTYSPYKELKTPNKLDVLTAGVSYSLSSHEELSSSLALSSYQQNLYADSRGSTGWALRSGLKSKGRPAFFGYSWNAGVQTEFLDRNFSLADPIRSVEFDRNWGVTDLQRKSNDFVLKTHAGIEHADKGYLLWNGQWREKGTQVSGFNHEATLEQNLKLVHIKGQARWMENNTKSVNSKWRKYQVELKYPGKLIQPGYRFITDKNLAYNNLGDSLLSSIQNYEEHTLFISNGAEAGTGFSGYYGIRNDFLPNDGVISMLSKTETWHIEATRKFKAGNLDAGISRREMKDEVLTTSTLLGNVKGSLSLFKGAIRTSFRGETSSGWEPKREYIYREVPAGQGHYAWRDLNKDGIQQIGEFFEAILFDEQNFVRFYVSSPERTPAFQSNLFASVRLRWPEGVSKESWVQKISALIQLSSTGKTTDSRKRLTAVSNSLDDVDILSGRRKFSARLYAKELWEVISLEGGIHQYENKNWVLNGFEKRGNSIMDAAATVGIGSFLDWTLSGIKENRNNDSNVLQGRKYTFSRSIYRSAWSWRPQPGISGETSYSYKTSSGTGEDELVTSQTHLINAAFQWRASAKTILKNELEWAEVQYEGNPNSALGYDLMEAFLPGNNLRWIFSFQRELKSGLLVNLMYIGRKAPSRTLINRASLQLSARF